MTMQMRDPRPGLETQSDTEWAASVERMITGAAWVILTVLLAVVGSALLHRTGVL